MPRSRPVTGLFALAAAIAACAPVSAQDYYAGKTVEMIVGGGAGGGYDIYARTVARHMTNIRTKLGVASRAAATAKAIEHGWLTRR